MANVLGELFSDIAGAIRSKTGDAGTMKPAEFSDKILEISAGSTEKAIVTKRVTLTVNTVESISTLLLGRSVVEHNLGVVPDIVILYPDNLVYTGTAKMLEQGVFIAPRPEIFGECAGLELWSYVKPAKPPAIGDSNPYYAITTYAARATMDDWMNVAYDGPISLINENTMRIGGMNYHVTKGSTYRCILVGGL